MIQANPVLAFFYQKYDPNVSYLDAKLATPAAPGGKTRMPGWRTCGRGK